MNLKILVSGHEGAEREVSRESQRLSNESGDCVVLKSQGIHQSRSDTVLKIGRHDRLPKFRQKRSADVSLLSSLRSPLEVGSFEVASFHALPIRLL